MTDTDLKKLRRSELLEFLLDVTKENQRLKKELRETREQLRRQQAMLDCADQLLQSSDALTEFSEGLRDAGTKYRRMREPCDEE